MFGSQGLSHKPIISCTWLYQDIGVTHSGVHTYPGCGAAVNAACLLRCAGGATRPLIKARLWICGWRSGGLRSRGKGKADIQRSANLQHCLINYSHQWENLSGVSPGSHCSLPQLLALPSVANPPANPRSRSSTEVGRQEWMNGWVRGITDSPLPHPTPLSCFFGSNRKDLIFF